MRFSIMIYKFSECIGTLFAQVTFANLQFLKQHPQFNCNSMEFATARRFLTHVLGELCHTTESLELLR